VGENVEVIPLGEKSALGKQAILYGKENDSKRRKIYWETFIVRGNLERES